ncbi:MAG TPA: DUF167 domain-containing protein [Candidatus Acidoferrum sp.]|nr:DUF167 domain-containing protein [Candidatus Acidoferrum sp.]
MAIEVKEQSGSVTFRVRVQPRASRDEVGGEWEGALKVRLTAPPVDDRANEALCRVLAARLNVPAAAVKILGGERSRIKRIEVRGVSAELIRALGTAETPRARKPASD